MSNSVGSTTTKIHHVAGDFVTQSGAVIRDVELAYEVYGEINAARDNVILVFHALTGSQHAAGYCESIPEAGKHWTPDVYKGWWDGYIGPGRGFDTDEYAVLCINYLSGCYGSTGPSSIDPDTGSPYGSSFPKLTLTDIVDSQVHVLDALGIDRLHAVAGGSVGGLMCAVFATRYPERVGVVVPLAAGLGVTKLQVLHNFEQMFAIVTDPDFKGGDYYPGPGPETGLGLARMISHKTFVSLEMLAERAREEIDIEEDLGGYRVGHHLESYMLHQARKFVKRFDANTYLRIMNVWQQFDLVEEVGGDSFADLFSRCVDQRWQVFTIDSDVCFYAEEQTRLETELKAAGVSVRRHTVHSDKGHDSFLIEPHLYTALLRDALDTHWH